MNVQRKLQFRRSEQESLVPLSCTAALQMVLSRYVIHLKKYVIDCTKCGCNSIESEFLIRHLSREGKSFAETVLVVNSIEHMRPRRQRKTLFRNGIKESYKDGVGEGNEMLCTRENLKKRFSKNDSINSRHFRANENIAQERMIKEFSPASNSL